MVLVPSDQAAAIRLFVPSLERTSIPRGALSGRPPVPAEDTEALGVRAILVAREDVEDAVIEKLTDTLLAARNELTALTERAALIGGADVLRALGAPIHAGALRYYNSDAPPFFVRYSDTIALAVSLAALVLSGLWQLNRWIKTQQKNRGDKYNQELLHHMELLRSARTADEVSKIEQDMFGIFHLVISDIDTDRFAIESLPSFTLIWQSASDLVARRKAQFHGSIVEAGARSEGAHAA